MNPTHPRHHRAGRLVCALAATATLGVSAAACGSDADHAGGTDHTEHAASTDVTDETVVDETVVDETVDVGGTPDAGAGLPNGWPSDIALPSELHILYSAAASDGTDTLSIIGESALRGQAFINFFRTSLGDWTIDSEADLSTSDATSVGISMSKGARVLTISVTGDRHSDAPDAISITHVVE